MADVLSDLLVRLDVDSAKFRNEIDKANEKLDELGKKIEAAGEKSEKGFKLEIAKIGFEDAKRAFEVLEQIAEAEKRVFVGAREIGTSVEFYSALSFAATEAGAESEKFAKGIAELQRRAAEGNKEFKSLGISLRDSHGFIKTGRDLYEEFADKVASASSHAEALQRAAAGVGAKIGHEMLPFLEKGRDGIKEAREELQRFGGVITTEQAKIGVDFVKALDHAKIASEGLARAWQTDVGPTLTHWIDDVAKVTADSRFFSVFADAADAAFGTSAKFDGAAKSWADFSIRMHLLNEKAKEHKKAAEEAAIADEDLDNAMAKLGTRGTRTAGEIAEAEAAAKKLNAELDAAAERLLGRNDEKVAAELIKRSTQRLGLEEEIAKYKKLGLEYDRELATRKRGDDEERSIARVEALAEGYGQIEEHFDRMHQRTDRWINLLGGQGAAAVATLTRALVHGENVLDAMVGFAENLGIRLLEDATRAAIIAAIKVATNATTLGYGAAFWQVLGGSGGASGGTVGTRGIMSFAGGGEVPRLGVPGRDSVPAWLMPGEVITNPARGQRAPGSALNLSIQLGAQFQSLHPSTITDTNRWLDRDFMPAFTQMARNGRLDEVIRRVMRQL